MGVVKNKLIQLGLGESPGDAGLFFRIGKTHCKQQITAMLRNRAEDRGA
jgi:hypothetical protein